ncbi:unnamed protein product [Soboliphyme baturini]|uniref:Thyroid adenoma-associated protein homolog n=1 Tax=Soboliphyme baturini TaxID=241478 RepID=A0A183IAL8_9BILA|nr:unnamed protein product [Soboliphyme baturini]
MNGMALVLDCLISFLRKDELTTNETEQNWLDIVARFTQKVRTLETIDCHQVIMHVVVPFANTCPRICLRLLELLFSREQTYCKNACEQVTAHSETVFLPLMNTIYDLFVWAFQDQSEQRSELVNMVLSAVDGIQYIDNVEISPEDASSMKRKLTSLPLHIQAYLIFSMLKFCSDGNLSFPVPECLTNAYRLSRDIFDAVPCHHEIESDPNILCIIRSTLRLSAFNVDLLRHFLKNCDLDFLVNAVETDWQSLRSVLMRYFFDSLAPQNIETWKKVLSGVMLLFTSLREAAASLHDRTPQQQTKIFALELLAPVT